MGQGGWSQLRVEMRVMHWLADPLWPVTDWLQLLGVKSRAEGSDDNRQRSERHNQICIQSERMAKRMKLLIAVLMSWNVHTHSGVTWGYVMLAVRFCFGLGVKMTGSSQRLTDGTVVVVLVTGCLRPIPNARTSSSCSETWRIWRGCGPAGSSGHTAYGQSTTHNQPLIA